MADETNDQGLGAQQPNVQLNVQPEGTQPAVIPGTQETSSPLIAPQSTVEVPSAATVQPTTEQPVTTAQPTTAQPTTAQEVEQTAPTAQPADAYQQAYQTDAAAATTSTTSAPTAAPTATVPPTGTPVAPQPISPQPGTPQPGVPQPGAPQPSATGALVCGILAIVFCFLPIVGIILGIVAIVLAGKYFRAGGTQGTGKAGRICGIIGIVASIVMIIINIVLVVGAFMVASTYDAPGSNYSTPASSSSYSYAALSESEEEAITQAAEEQLDKIKNADPETMQQIADLVQSSFDESAGYSGVGDMTLATLGIDPMVVAQKLTEDFDYEPFYTSASSDDAAEADFDITYVSVLDVLDEFDDLLDDFMDSSEYDAITSEEQAYQAIGQLLLQAIDNTKPTDKGFMTLSLDRVDNEWVVDEDSWEDELDYFFAFI